MNMHLKKKYTNEDFLQIIGNISIVFAAMDFFVTQLLFRLMSAKAYDDLKINDSTTLGTKLNKLNKIKDCDVDYPLVLAELKKILPKAIGIARERNRYIHDVWLFNEIKIANGEIDRLRFKRTSGFNINFTDDSDGVVVKKIEDLNCFCKDIISIQGSIAKICSDVPDINIYNVEMNK